MARIDAYFQYLVANKGSDLHLSEGQPPKVRKHGSVVAISGEAGIGKTRLATEFERETVRDGFLAAWGRTQETPGAPASASTARPESSAMSHPCVNWP